MATSWLIRRSHRGGATITAIFAARRRSYDIQILTSLLLFSA